MREISLRIDNKICKVITDNSKVQLSNKHYVTSGAVAWTYEKNACFHIFSDIVTVSIDSDPHVNIVKQEKTEVKPFPYPAFFCYLYMEEYLSEPFRFEFLKDGKVFQYFDVVTNFKGWKDINLTYDFMLMSGKQRDAYDELRIIYKGDNSGVIYMDDFRFHEISNPIFLYSKMVSVIPNMNKHTRRGITTQENHLDMLMPKPILPKTKEITDAQKKAFKIICDRYIDAIDELDTAQFRKSEILPDMDNLYESWTLKESGGYINGKLVTEKNIGAFTKLIKSMAMYYKKYPQEAYIKKYDEKYITMLRYIMECNPHKVNWYNGRGLASSVLIMKDVIKKAGIYEETVAFLRDNYEINKIYQVTSSGYLQSGRFEDTDCTGTCLLSMLVCILLAEDTPEKVDDMKYLLGYIEDYCLGMSPGLSGGYKTDGTAFHHGGYIKQYAIVANYTLARVFYLFSDTEFALSKKAADVFKKSLLTQFLMYNGPFETFSLCQYGYGFMHITKDVAYSEPIQATIMEFALFAKAVKDDMVAGMYMGMADRLSQEMKKYHYMDFLSQGIKPIHTIDCHKTLTHCGTAIHRRNDDTVMVRSYSKYVYSVEIWQETNKPGSRYSAFALYRNYGFLELLKVPEVDGGVNNGIYLGSGFDYRRWPGTTVPIIPLTQLKSVPDIVEGEYAEWLFQDEGFVGGLDTSDDNGVFVTQLRGSAKYGIGSHYANKSYHFFDDYIVCLGSNITNDIDEVPTETILFQDCGKGAIKKGNLLVDNRGHGYYVCDNHQIDYYEKHVHSRDMMDRFDTEGDRTFAVISHGNSPFNESYAYIVKLETDIDEMEKIDFKNRFSVLQQDESAHIVLHDNTLNYVLFKKNYDLSYGVIKAVTEKCIISERKTGENEIKIAVCDPDLHLYQNDFDNYNLHHEFTDQSIYGRPWFNNPGMQVKIWVVLRTTVETMSVLNGNAKIVQNWDNQCIVEFECTDGLTNEIQITL